jgi:hypothetical protein
METDPTHDWLKETLAGFTAMAGSESEAAARHWLRAREAFRPADIAPLLAATHTNAGVGYALLRRMGEAETAFAEAERTWARVLRDVETMEIPVVGISSAFHFRLASQNFSAFEAARRRRYAQLCEAAVAITRFNRGWALSSRDAVAASARSLAGSLAEVLGPRAPEIRLLSGAATPDAGLSPYADKVVWLESRQRSLSDALSDTCRHLIVATHLTALLGPLPTTPLPATDRP